MPTQTSKTDKPYDRSETCLLCGIHILRFQNGTISNGHLGVLKESQWEIHRKLPIPEHILVPSIEVENNIFSKFPWLSSCYQRGAVRYASSSLDYELTGIGPVARRACQPYQLPRDKNTARISGREAIPQYDDTIFTHFHPEGYWMNPRLYKDRNMGYVFHYYCWEILGHLVGKELIEKKLDQVVQAARKYWKANKEWGRTDLDTLTRAQIRKIPYVRCKYYYFGCDIFVNPWIIPELQSTIQLARDMVGKRKSSYLNKLPLEISLLVAEIICPIIYTQSDVQNMRNTLSVFALNLPDTFWRNRLHSKHDLFFEVDKLEADSVDWQLLWLGFMDLLSDKWYKTSGLANRERLLGPIRGIIANFQ